jgi:hypothetical protein
MEVEATRIIHDLKAIRDEIDGWRVVAVLREASLASLAAGRASQVFVPLIFHGDNLDAKVYEQKKFVCPVPDQIPQTRPTVNFKLTPSKAT